MRRLLILACLSLSTIAHAQSARVPANYKRMLLPVHASARPWSVQWWFRNEGTTAVDAFPLASPCGFPAPFPSTVIIGKPSLPPQTTVNCPADDTLPALLVTPFVPVISSGPGAFLYVDKPEQVTIGGFVRRDGSSGVAALQAISEDAFIGGTRSILPVVVFPNRRYAIRIYALPETMQQSPRVRVRVYDMQPVAHEWPREELAATYDVQLRMPVSSVRPCINECDVPDATYAPAAAEVFDLIPPFGPKPIHPAARIEIVPESSSLRWWAVVSATDNDTHEISVYQPAR